MPKPFNPAYGLVWSEPDPRDWQFARISQPVVLPDLVDLREPCPPVYDQLQEGSCTGNAIAGAYEFDLIKQGFKPFVPSRQFIYYNERLMEGDVNQDGGAQIRDGIKSIASTGVCDELIWPYNESNFTTKPSDEAYADGLKHTALNYYSVPITINDMKQALAQGYPIVGGIMVFSSFESDEVAATGIVSMPDMVSDQCIGGHAILYVGYDNTKQHFIVRNSWGDDWGDKGYFYLPFTYCTPNLMSDMWVVKTVLG